MFFIYFIYYGCNGGALVFIGGAEASASPSFALPMFITIKKIIILHLFLGVPAATVGGTGTPWHTRGYAPGIGVKWRKDEVYSVCWGGYDQSLEWIKARSSLRSKRSVITPLWIHSGFYIPAHGETALCSLHLNVIMDYWGKRNM